MRVGKKKQPTYRVVVADGRSPRDGRFIEIIGQYAPRQDPSFFQIDAESALAWLRKGAQPTEQVQKLLIEQGVWAEYEGGRSKPAVTKLSRRGYVSGKVARGEKKMKAEAPAPVGAPPSAEAPADAAAADDAPPADDAPEASTDVPEASTDAPTTDENPADDTPAEDAPA